MCTIRLAFLGHVTSAKARDKAIVTPMDCSGLRSEVAALDCSLAAAEADGSECLTITLSTTDQDGSGAVVAVNGRAMRDLDNWADMQGHGRVGSAFGPSGHQVHKI